MKSKWMCIAMLSSLLVVPMASVPRSVGAEIEAKEDCRSLSAEGYGGPPLIWPFAAGHDWKVLSRGGYNTLGHGGGHCSDQVSGNCREFCGNGTFHSGNEVDKFTFDLERKDISDSSGQEIYAVQDGKVWWKGTGSLLLHLQDANGNPTRYYVFYGHIMPSVNQGDTKNIGQKLGVIDNTQNPPHLHLFIAKWNTTGNPTSFPGEGWIPVYFQNVCGQNYPFDVAGGCNQYHDTVIKPCSDDTTPPTISFSTPSQERWYNTDQTLFWTISDPESGIDKYEWWWNDTPPRPPVALNGQLEATGSTELSTAGQGKHTLHVKAWDIARNPPASASAGWFGYDTIPPRRPSINEIGCNARNNQWQNACLDPSFTWVATDRNGDKGSGVSQYAYAWGTEPRASQANWSSWSGTTSYDPGPIAVEDGWAQYFLHVKSRDVAGKESSPATFGFWYDGTSPTITDFSINHGASTTNKTNVRLDVTTSDTGSGVAAICVTDSAEACSDWRSYNDSTLYWTLSAMNHYTHTLYATVRDWAGNESEAVSDTIYLDLDPPMPHSANYRICQYVLDIGGLERIISTNYSLVSAVGQPWATGADVSTSAGFTEQAGFLASSTGCLPISHTPAPTLPLFITPTLPSSFEVSINGGDSFYTNNPLVEVEAPAPNVTHMKISNSSTYTDTDWQTYQLTTTWSISVPMTLGSSYVMGQSSDYATPHFVYIWFGDQWDNVYGPYFDIIIYDPIAPEGQVAILDSGTNTVTLSLEAWDDNSGVIEMRVGESPTFEGSSWQPYEEVIDWPLTTNVYVQFRDRAGNTSPVYALKLSNQGQIYLPVILKRFP
jgi:hypothetical protein